MVCEMPPELDETVYYRWSHAVSSLEWRQQHLLMLLQLSETLLKAGRILCEPKAVKVASADYV